MRYISEYVSPLGVIILSSDGERLTGLLFRDQNKSGSAPYFDAAGNSLAFDVAINNLDFDADGNSGCIYDVSAEELPIFRETKKWLNIYFDGTDPEFTPPIRLEGTEFRKDVWSMLMKVPYGRTITYGEIAEKLAEKYGMARMSSQAVGNAAAHNPILLIVPCHRVIGKNGCLTGYAGGIDRKRKLLYMEMTACRTRNDCLANSK